jgi:hypothetical protein
VALISLYLAKPEWREELRFVVITLATAGGVASAYYVGRGLRATADSNRITRSFSYPARWGDPSWAPARRIVGRVLIECRGKPEPERLRIMKDAIETDSALEVETISVLNFLEELSLAVNLGLADEEVIYRYYRGTVVRTFDLLAPWIREHRDKREAPRRWLELEKLYEAWRGRE